MIETIRLSQQARDQLIKLKRVTGLKNWNVLCRWAFCRSLAEPSVPTPVKIPTDSNVEMTWRVFGGAQADLYLAVLKVRCRRDGRRCNRPDYQRTTQLHESGSRLRAVEWRTCGHLVKLFALRPAWA